MNKLSLDKSRIKIVLLEGIHDSAVRALAADGYTQVVRHARSLTGPALQEALADAHFVGIRSRTGLTEEVLAAAPKLTGVGCFCIGTNQVDLAAAARRGIPVFNAPFSNTRSVAELVIAEAVMLMRGIPERSALAHRGGWQKSADGSFEVRGKTLGIVGYGHIGTQVGILAEALGMRVTYFDVEARLPLGNASAAASLDELLENADVVTLHVPETPATHNMIGAAQLAQMKPGARLINASRGTVVDLEALAVLLREGYLSGAAIDAFPVEPKGNDDEFVSPLRGLDNVILTPHIGGSTVEAQANIGAEVAAKLIRYSNNGSTLSAVNFPEVSLPEQRGHTRLLHIHRNQPGVLAAINDCFGRQGINIAAQYLQTSPELGYVVIDTDSPVPESLLAGLGALDGTLRCRLLY